MQRNAQQFRALCEEYALGKWLCNLQVSTSANRPDIPGRCALHIPWRSSYCTSYQYWSRRQPCPNCMYLCNSLVSFASAWTNAVLFYAVKYILQGLELIWLIAQPGLPVRISIYISFCSEARFVPVIWHEIVTKYRRFDREQSQRAPIGRTDVECNVLVFWQDQSTPPCQLSFW